MEDDVQSTVWHLSEESPLTNVFHGLETHYRHLQYVKNFDFVVG